MLAAADRHLTGLAEWNEPQAGMFVWFKLNGISDTQSLIEQKARDANVLLVPGVCFSTTGTGYIFFSYISKKDLHCKMTIVSYFLTIFFKFIV